MNANLVNVLRTKSAYLPGGRDRDGNLLLIATVPSHLHPKAKENLELCVNFILEALSNETLTAGLTVIIDGQKTSWRLTKSWMAHVKSLVDVDYLKNAIIVRSDAFWDKQRVESCTKSHKLGELTIIPRSRLAKYVDTSELPEDLGGTFSYTHEQWIQNHVRIQEFRSAHGKAITDLENLQTLLVQNQTIMVRAKDIEMTIRTCTICTNDVQRYAKFVMDMGNRLINEINELQHSKSAPSSTPCGTRLSSGPTFTSQDLLDAREMIKHKMNEIEGRQVLNNAAWDVLELKAADLREIAKLEDGVKTVTNWILTDGDKMMNEQLEVPFDLASAQRLRFEHEMMELKCCTAYGQYGEMKYKIDNLHKSGDAINDLRAQKEFMGFVCRSFATRMEKRRNILILSLRFFKMVAEYFEGTSNAFETLIMGNKALASHEATKRLEKLCESEQRLEFIQQKLVSEGEKLTDLLAIPVKNSLGAEITTDYSSDIANIRDILDATISRKNIFKDSVVMEKLTLKQVTFINHYEEEAQTACKWMTSLYQVLVKSHTHVGCTVLEIQRQKEQQQNFQDTGKATYNYGTQLLHAASTLRHTAKLHNDKNIAIGDQLHQTWKKLHAISDEQMTRLRVSAVFHRSVDEQVEKITELKKDLVKLYKTNDMATRKRRNKQVTASREKLLAEIGRMVRLGRLLKTRLKEPFVLENNTTESMSQEIVEPDNIIACDAIASRLNDVTELVEDLNQTLKEIQDDLGLSEPESEVSVGDKRRPASDDWNNCSSVKSSTESESYITASEGHHHSRSSSFHTVSECAHSPWWSDSIERNSLDADSLDQEVPTMELLSGVVVSSGNVSFDDTAVEHQSFESPEPQDEIMPTLTHMPPPLPRKASHDSGNFESHEEDSKSGASSVDILDQQLHLRVNSSQSDSACSVDKHSPSLNDSGDDLVEVRPGYDCVSVKDTGLSYYYQNIIAAQSLKTCL